MTKKLSIEAAARKAYVWGVNRDVDFDDAFEYDDVLDMAVENYSRGLSREEYKEVDLTDVSNEAAELINEWLYEDDF